MFQFVPVELLGWKDATGNKEEEDEADVVASFVAVSLVVVVCLYKSS